MARGRSGRGSDADEAACASTWTSAAAKCAAASTTSARSHRCASSSAHTEYTHTEFEGDASRHGVRQRQHRGAPGTRAPADRPAGTARSALQWGAARFRRDRRRSVRAGVASRATPACSGSASASSATRCSWNSARAHDRNRDRCRRTRRRSARIATSTPPASPRPAVGTPAKPAPDLRPGSRAARADRRGVVFQRHARGDREHRARHAGARCRDREPRRTRPALAPRPGATCSASLYHVRYDDFIYLADTGIDRRRPARCACGRRATHASTAPKAEVDWTHRRQRAPATGTCACSATWCAASSTGSGTRDVAFA